MLTLTRYQVRYFTTRVSQTHFPCLDKHSKRQDELKSTTQRAMEGPEPNYAKVVSGYDTFTYTKPFKFQHGGQLLHGYQIAYETWGQLNADRTNAILLHTGLSASSHAKSRDKNKSSGWWEQFIGPGLSLDTNKFFVICTNVLGSCYGSSGPSTIDPETKLPYATTFPTLTIHDMVRAQRILLHEQFGIPYLHASVGSSMGGMQSLAMSQLFPEFVKRCVSISACARSHPYSMALRYAQRAILLNDPNWNRGFYYPEFKKSAAPPHVGMKLARMVATVGYRSGPEWESRFGRRKMTDTEREAERERMNVQHPRFCPEYLIETYLDHQGEKFCLQYDANSLLYVSKAMDLFDLSVAEEQSIEYVTNNMESVAMEIPPVYETRDMTKQEEDLGRGLSKIKADTLILGVQSDILFPISQQKEIADVMREHSDAQITYYELDSIYGHDTFLMDVLNTGAAVKGHLER